MDLRKLSVTYLHSAEFSKPPQVRESVLAVPLFSKVTARFPAGRRPAPKPKWCSSPNIKLSSSRQAITLVMLIATSSRQHNAGWNARRGIGSRSRSGVLWRIFIILARNSVTSFATIYLQPLAVYCRQKKTQKEFVSPSSTRLLSSIVGIQYILRAERSRPKR